MTGIGLAIAVVTLLAVACGGSPAPHWSAAGRSWDGVEYTYAANVHVVRVDTRDAADRIRRGAIMTVQCGGARGRVVAGGVSTVTLDGDARGRALVCDLFEPGRERCGMQASDPGYARLIVSDPPPAHDRLVATTPPEPTSVVLCNPELAAPGAQPHTDNVAQGAIVRPREAATLPPGDLDLAVRAPSGTPVCWEFETPGNRIWHAVPPAKIIRDGEPIGSWPVEASGGVLDLRWNAWELTPGIDDYPGEVRITAVQVDGDRSDCGGTVRPLGMVVVEYAP